MICIRFIYKDFFICCEMKNISPFRKNRTISNSTLFRTCTHTTWWRNQLKQQFVSTQQISCLSFCISIIKFPLTFSNQKSLVTSCVIVFLLFFLFEYFVILSLYHNNNEGRKVSFHSKLPSTTFKFPFFLFRKIHLISPHPLQAFEGSTS